MPTERIAASVTLEGTTKAQDGSAAETKPGRDKSEQQLDTLREAAKKKFGERLEDATLRKILKRFEAKLAREKDVKESQASFETSQNKETLSSKQTDPTTKALKATGASEELGADGLTAKQLTAVRSDPDAAPVLPPTKTPPATPEEAQSLLGRMFVGLETGAQSLSVESYADTVKSKPAAKPQAQTPRAKTTGATIQYSSAATGLGVPGTSAKVAFAPTRPGNPGSSKTSEPGLGGGLTSTLPFDGLHFNWDAFFTHWLLRNVQDLGEYLRAMRRLTKAAGETALASRDLEIALMKVRQEVERMQTIKDFSQATSNLGDTARQQQIKKIMGESTGILDTVTDVAQRAELMRLQRANLAKDESSEATRQVGKLDELFKKIDPDGKKFGNRRILTKSELSGAGSAEYAEITSSLARAEGSLGSFARLIHERDQIKKANPPLPEAVQKDIEEQLGAAFAKLKHDIAQASKNPKSYAELRAQFQGLAQYAQAPDEPGKPPMGAEKRRELQAKALALGSALAPCRPNPGAAKLPAAPEPQITDIDRALDDPTAGFKKLSEFHAPNQGLYNLKVEQWLSRADLMAGKFDGAMRPFSQMVTEAVEKAAGMAGSTRKEMTNKMRGILMQAQGMYNQLVQLLQMQRSS